MINKETIKELAELMKEYKLTEIKYEGEDDKLCLKREGSRPEPPHMPIHMTPPAWMGGVAPAFTDNGVVSKETDSEAAIMSVSNATTNASGKSIKAPLVGTFYVAPGEGKAPYVKVGDHVKKGQIVGIIEAMKLMNEIESDVEGVVIEISAQNGKMVEFGQELIRVQ